MVTLGSSVSSSKDRPHFWPQVNFHFILAYLHSTIETTGVNGLLRLEELVFGENTEHKYCKLLQAKVLASFSLSLASWPFCGGANVVLSDSSICPLATSHWPAEWCTEYWFICVLQRMHIYICMQCACVHVRSSPLQHSNDNDYNPLLVCCYECCTRVFTSNISSVTGTQCAEQICLVAIRHYSVVF